MTSAECAKASRAACVSATSAARSRDVLDHHDARIAPRRDADGDDRGEALAVLAAEDDVILTLTEPDDLVVDGADSLHRLGRPVRERRGLADELILGEAGELAHPSR